MEATKPLVVDTDVVSFLFKSHSFAPAYQTILAGRPLAVSLVTLAEIEYGMEMKNWGAGRRDLMRHFLARLTPLFATPRLPSFGRGSKAAVRGRSSDHIR
jgi:predicted nucleic acid-binding protein